MKIMGAEVSVCMQESDVMRMFNEYCPADENSLICTGRSMRKEMVGTRSTLLSMSLIIWHTRFIVPQRDQ